MPYFSSNLCSDKVSATVRCSCVLWFITSGAWPFADNLDLDCNLLRWFYHLFTAYFLDGSCAVRRDALQAWTDSNEQCEIWTGLLMVMDSWTSKLLEPNMPYIKWLKSTGWRCNYQKHSGFLTLDISQLYKLVSFLPEAMLSLRSIDHSFTLCECI